MEGLWLRGEGGKGAEKIHREEEGGCCVDCTALILGTCS